MKIGVISDTHGLLRPEALETLRSVKMILHAGDIGKPEVLDKLSRIAPVLAVRGNNDKGVWAKEIPETRIVAVGGISIYMLHDLKEISIDPAVEGHRVVIAGHSHKPSASDRNGVLYLNPGSAGPRRFKLPVCTALLNVKGKSVQAEVIELSA